MLNDTIGRISVQCLQNQLVRELKEFNLEVQPSFTQSDALNTSWQQVAINILKTDDSQIDEPSPRLLATNDSNSVSSRLQTLPSEFQRSSTVRQSPIMIFGKTKVPYCLDRRTNSFLLLFPTKQRNLKLKEAIRRKSCDCQECGTQNVFQKRSSFQLIKKVAIITKANRNGSMMTQEPTAIRESIKPWVNQGRSTNSGVKTVISSSRRLLEEMTVLKEQNDEVITSSKEQSSQSSFRVIRSISQKKHFPLSRLPPPKVSQSPKNNYYAQKRRQLEEEKYSRQQESARFITKSKRQMINSIYLNFQGRKYSPSPNKEYFNDSRLKLPSLLQRPNKNAS